MSENISVNLQSGGCVDCSNCGLCGKGKKEASVVTDSVNAPQVSGSLAALNGLAGSGMQAGTRGTADEISTLVAVCT